MNDVMKLRSVAEVCTEIHIKRIEMMKLAQTYGINCEETVRSSQELDLLINEYLILQQHSVIKGKEKMNSMVSCC